MTNFVLFFRHDNAFMLDLPIMLVQLASIVPKRHMLIMDQFPTVRHSMLARHRFLSAIPRQASARHYLCVQKFNLGIVISSQKQPFDCSTLPTEFRASNSSSDELRQTARD